MSSQKQIDANRRNAQLSTGPQTPEGRAAVRSNALRHGLTAKIAVLDNENPEHFQKMLDAFHAEHQPVGPTEDLLVQQIVMAAWRLQRLRGVETGLFNLRMRVLKLEMQNEFSLIEETERHAYVFRDDTRNADAIANLSRYETRIERSFYRALHELQHLQATRPPVTNPVNPLPDPCDIAPDPTAVEDSPLPAEPAPSVEVTESAKQTHSPNRTPPWNGHSCHSSHSRPATSPSNAGRSGVGWIGSVAAGRGAAGRGGGCVRAAGFAPRAGRCDAGVAIGLTSRSPI